MEWLSECSGLEDELLRGYVFTHTSKVITGVKGRSHVCARVGEAGMSRLRRYGVGKVLLRGVATAFDLGREDRALGKCQDSGGVGTWR